MYTIKIGDAEIKCDRPEDALSLIKLQKKVSVLERYNQPKLGSVKHKRGWRSRPWTYEEAQIVFRNANAGKNAERILRPLLPNRTVGAVKGALAWARGTWGTVDMPKRWQEHKARYESERPS